MDIPYSPPLSVPADHVGLYIHVPFCVRKCRYCDFASQPRCLDETLVARYLDALTREACLRRSEFDRPLHSIYLGGGTPTLLLGAELLQLWDEVIAPLARRADAEITIEANPGTLTDDVLDAVRTLPVTRVSMGVQSFHADELAMLGRVHTPQDAVTGVAALRAIGVPSLNLDLMYGLPGQTVERWEESLQQAMALSPEHLSFYSLMLEEGTPLAAQVAAGDLTLPGEEEEEAMAASMLACLVAAGYLPYEVSNAARPGQHSRHNLGYWLGRDYLGLGPSAASMCEGVRWRNAEVVADYIDRLDAGVAPVEYAERLSAPRRLLELVMLGTRLRAGFDVAAAEAACGITLEAVTGEALHTLYAEGMLERRGDILRLTAAGFPVANAIMARLLAAAEAGPAHTGR